MTTMKHSCFWLLLTSGACHADLSVGDPIAGRSIGDADLAGTWTVHAGPGSQSWTFFDDGTATLAEDDNTGAVVITMSGTFETLPGKLTTDMVHTTDGWRQRTVQTYHVNETVLALDALQADASTVGLVGTWRSSRVVEVWLSDGTFAYENTFDASLDLHDDGTFTAINWRHEFVDAEGIYEEVAAGFVVLTGTTTEGAVVSQSLYVVDGAALVSPISYHFAE